MKVITQAIDFALSSELQTFIAESAVKLLPLPVSIIRAEFILGEDSGNKKARKFCNVRLITVGNGYLVSQHAATYEDAITSSVAELESKIKRDNSRAIQH